jgi:hypothetical protein
VRQRTLGIIGAALVVAGVAVDVGSDIAARRFVPAATLAPAGGQVQLPRRPGDGMQPGHPLGHHDRVPLNP